jgi:SAM-dependent methyltransferase
MAGRAVAREPKEIVARGYDAIALRYAEWAGQVDSPAMEWVRDFDARLDDGADVLELGCGRGVPATRELARRHRVTGVDISAVQIELARHHVPEASFIHADAMVRTALDNGEIDATARRFEGQYKTLRLGYDQCLAQMALLMRKFLPTLEPEQKATLEENLAEKKREIDQPDRHLHAAVDVVPR